MVAVDELHGRLGVAFPDADVQVADTTGEGDHFEVRVRAAAFAGTTLIQQHRMVYDALGDLMSQIHALSLHTEEA